MSDLQAPGDGGPQYAYMRVAEDIAARITSGELRPGARLRSERDLAEHYGVAFHTIRNAMKVLRDRGTFVREDLP
jgi:DNA-binding GntR family transcriptional regulator